jgi:type IV secretory pathway VirB4 component
MSNQEEQIQKESWSDHKKNRKQELEFQAQSRKRELEAARIFEEGVASVKDLIAPSSMNIETNYIQVGNKFVRTMFVFTYPRYLYTNWLAPVINFDWTMDISMFIYPVETKEIMENLRKKVGQMESSMMIASEKGSVRDPGLETALQDAEEMRDALSKGLERFFQFALYFTVYADSLKELDDVTKQLETILGGKLVYTKQATLQMEQGFNSTLPQGTDQLMVMRNMDTSSLSSTFPFTSMELTQEVGIFYGINLHNNGLVIFDRFTLENANSTIFATSGAGKSYTVKLEAMRHLMLGSDIIIIDPENEYEKLCETVGGSYLKVSLKSNHRINPFELPQINDESAEDVDPLKANIIMLSGLLNVMIGPLSPVEGSILDKAITETYSLRDITSDPATHKNPAPLMNDLQNVLENMKGSENMIAKLTKFTTGSFAGLFNEPSNINMQNRFVVFSLRDLEDQLRPIAMHMIISFIWNNIKYEKRKRLLIVDEAWLLMQNEDSAKFMYAIVKRARKYHLGVTTITQDVEDFLNSQYGKAIVTNSAMQILLKQSTSAIDLISHTFKLTTGESQFLISAGVGEGIFFAGSTHVAIKIYASYYEDSIITTNPEQLEQMKKTEGENVA